MGENRRRRRTLDSPGDSPPFSARGGSGVAISGTAYGCCGKGDESQREAELGSCSLAGTFVSDRKVLAPQVELEPTTLRLTPGCSAIELLKSSWQEWTKPFQQVTFHAPSGACQSTRHGAPFSMRVTSRGGVNATALLDLFAVGLHALLEDRPWILSRAAEFEGSEIFVPVAIGSMRLRFHPSLQLSKVVGRDLPLPHSLKEGAAKGRSAHDANRRRGIH